MVKIAITYIQSPQRQESDKVVAFYVVLKKCYSSSVLISPNPYKISQRTAKYGYGYKKVCKLLRHLLNTDLVIKEGDRVYLQAKKELADKYAQKSKKRRKYLKIQNVQYAYNVIQAFSITNKVKHCHYAYASKLTTSNKARNALLKQIVGKFTYISVDNIADLLKVSKSTARRTLRSLHDMGAIDFETFRLQCFGKAPTRGLEDINTQIFQSAGCPTKWGKGRLFASRGTLYFQPASKITVNDYAVEFLDFSFYGKKSNNDMS